MVDYAAIADVMVEKTILYLPKIVVAIIVLVIGLWIISILGKMIEKKMGHKKVDPSLRHFLASLIRISLKIILFITVIGMFGVQMTSFIAIIGAAGLAIGLALQGSLANFAGGVLILLFKPFVVGDLLEAQGHFGRVHKIKIFNTILKTMDNKTVIIPNGALSNGDMINYTTEPDRRVDMVFGIGYGDDIKKAQKVIEDVLKKNKKILKKPAPQVRVSELADSSVNFVVRPWCKAEDYWDVNFWVTENIKLAFDKNKISIPFPQRDVHMHKGK